MKRMAVWCAAALLMSTATMAVAQERPARPVFDPALMIQGEYVGEVPATVAENATKMGVQIVALGNDEYQLVAFKGGLPGEEGVAWPPVSQETVKVKFADGKLSMTGDGWATEMSMPGPGVTAERTAARERGENSAPTFGRGAVGGGFGFTVPIRIDGKEYSFRKVNRRSETLGEKAPEGAIMMFEGNLFGGFGQGAVRGMRGQGGNATTGERPSRPAVNISTENLAQGVVDEVTGLLTEKGGVITKERFQDFQLHLEFRLPLMAEARGQARANSGLYLQGRYEVQILDSFGLEPKDNECGGIYSISVPKVNACFPPMAWQTYDVEFTAAKFDANGERTAPAHAVVKLNGILIHDTDLEHATPGGVVTPRQSPRSGPIFLQDHASDPVRFRNFWVLSK